MKLVKLTASPFTPNLETVGDMVIQLGGFSPDGVEIELAPNVVDYQEKADQPGMLARQLIVTTNTDETRRLIFDLKSNSTQVVSFGGRDIEIKLMQIGREKFEGQDFFSYEFQVSDSQAPGVVQNEGTIRTWLRGSDTDWLSNDKPYALPTFAQHGVRIDARKNPDRTMHVEVSGPLGRTFTFHKSIPQKPNERLHLLVAWKHPEIKLYLQAELVDTQQVA